MKTFNSTFSHLAGDNDLEKFVGRRVRFDGARSSDGEIHRKGIFEVVGTQLNYRREPCLRVKCVEFDGKPNVDNFWHVMSLDRVAFV